MSPMPSLFSHYVIRIAAVGVLGGCWLRPALAIPTTDPAAEPDAAARANWQAVMAHNTDSPEGCFKATYPSVVWEKVECKTAHPRFHPVHRDSSGGVGAVTGNGHDFVAKASGLITESHGAFPAVTGVKSEKSVGVAAFGGGGILGNNEYTLQANTNFNDTTSVCAGHSGCTVWQQFIYSTDYETDGEAAVFMQYWLIGWGSSKCPSGFGTDDEGDCYGNSSYVSAPDVPITSLAKLSLSGAAAAGGHDTVTFNNGTNAYSVSGKDSKLDISSVWHETEFNIVGDAGGSRADFNTGSSVTVKLSLSDGSTAKPTCVANAGTTGETNNLNLGSCSTAGGSSPDIEFKETN